MEQAVSAPKVTPETEPAQYEVERHGKTWRVRAMSRRGRPLTGRTIGVDMTEDEACACRDALNALARRNAPRVVRDRDSASDIEYLLKRNARKESGRG